MKSKVIIVMLCIISIVKGAIWGLAVVEPVIQMLGLGSVFAAWNMVKKSETYSDYIFKSEDDSDYMPKHLSENEK